MKTKLLTTLVAAGVMAGSMATAFAAEPKYKADVPASLITPDTVETKYLGDLKFVDGFPTDATLEKSYDFLDTSRAVQLFTSGIPTASMHGLLKGHRDIGVKPNKTVALTEELIDARSLWLTPNTTTPYIHIELNVKEGPVVFEVGTPVIGIVDNAWFLYVGDVGLGGPDKGKGGKYLLVGEDYKGEIPEGYFVMRTNTYRHWMLIRAVGKPGESVKDTLKAFKAGFKMYPLAQAENPEPNEFINISGKKYNTIHAGDASIYDELNEVIQYEPANSGDPELLGLAAELGISKGKPFTPDARMKKILDEAASIGNAASRAVMFKPRNKSVYFYPDRQWFSPLADGSSDFLDKNGARMLDRRIGFLYFATGVTPFMVSPKPGSGSVYEIAATDSTGKMLSGNNTYSVTLPGPVPAKAFWSFMVYDVHTRSILETDQKSGGIDSMAKDLKANADGSYTVYFASKPPKGKEGNWVQTMPNKGFHVLLRLYSPLQPWFDKTWKPGDFELVK